MKYLDCILFFIIGFAFNSFVRMAIDNSPYFVFPMWVLIFAVLIVLIKGDKQ